MVLRKRLLYCNKMNRFAEMFRVPGKISIQALIVNLQNLSFVRYYKIFKEKMPGVL